MPLNCLSITSVLSCGSTRCLALPHINGNGTEGESRGGLHVPGAHDLLLFARKIASVVLRSAPVDQLYSDFCLSHDLA